MFETIYSDAATAIDTSFNGSNVMLCISVSLLLGLIISTIYLIITPKKARSASFAMSVVILPTLVAIVILLVGGNLARAFSMAGVFTLVRFRSLPGDSKDISFIFLAMAVGLTTGMGYLTFGAMITLVIGLVLILISKLGFGISKDREKRLKILIPEDMNYQGAFEDLFKKYTKLCELQKVRTTDLGTLYELSYNVIMKEDVFEKDFIDELRCRNGNLSILLGIKETNSQQL